MGGGSPVCVLDTLAYPGVQLQALQMATDPQSEQPYDHTLMLGGLGCFGLIWTALGCLQVA